MLTKITYIIVLLTLTQCQEASNFQAGGNKDPDQMSAEEEGVVPPYQHFRRLPNVRN